MTYNCRKPRKFDYRTRDQKYLRFTLRLADLDREFVEAQAKSWGITPAQMTKELIKRARQRAEFEST